MKIYLQIIIDPIEASRLLCLIEDGLSILRQQGRTQRGIDGYYTEELNRWKDQIGKSAQLPKFGGNGNIVLKQGS